MQETLRAYVAGCMDSDGSYMIIGRGDGRRFEPTVALNQVTEPVPRLLLETFGGNYQYRVLGAPRRARYMWRGAWGTAEKVCTATLPYLRIKRVQAECLLELLALHRNSALRSYSYWYEHEHPDWRSEHLVTTRQAQVILGYKHPESVKQAIYGGCLLALPGKGGSFTPRIPKGQVEWLRSLREGAQIQCRNQGLRLPNLPPQLIDMRKALWLKVRQLNQRGC